MVGINTFAFGGGRGRMREDDGFGLLGQFVEDHVPGHHESQADAADRAAPDAATVAVRDDADRYEPGQHEVGQHRAGHHAVDRT